MRFRPKARKWQLIIPAEFAILSPILWSSHTGQPTKRFVFGALAILIVIQSLLDYFTHYWKIQPDALYRGRFWRCQRIGYPDIVAISPRQYWWTNAIYITIRYKHPSHTKTRRMIAIPDNPEPFLADLRLHAPQASVSVLTAEELQSPTFALQWGRKLGERFKH